MGQDDADFDYGPLAGLIGTWTGDKGMDVAPEPDGTERSPYLETITFEAAGDVTNAESQVLTVVRYHQVVSRKATGKVFHDQVGYWMWDAERSTVIQSLTIPRAVCVLAGGTFQGAPDPARGVVLEVAAKLGDPGWGIIQSPFMRDRASTREFRHTLKLQGDRLTYQETTVLDIYGRSFDHTDENELVRG
jgi:hypothetical protein